MKLCHSPGSLTSFLAVFSISCRHYHNGPSCVGKGGSAENAIVIYPDRLSERPSLPQAFAQHKVLDLVGDLYLLGRPLQAHIIGSRSGHQQNLELARKLAELSDL